MQEGGGWRLREETKNDSRSWVKFRILHAEHIPNIHAKGDNFVHSSHGWRTIKRQHLHTDNLIYWSNYSYYFFKGGRNGVVESAAFSGVKKDEVRLYLIFFLRTNDGKPMQSGTKWRLSFNFYGRKKSRLAGCSGRCWI